jgi:RecA-family ATPase
MLSTLAGYVAAQLGDFDEGGTFKPGPMYHGIAARAKSINAGLIVLDNIAHLFPGNEIVRRQVVGFLAAVDMLALECDASVLLLGHPAKAVGSEYSGNLGWSAHVRQRWFIGWGDPETGDTDTRILKKAKANLGKKGEEVTFRWHEWAFVRDEDLGEDVAREYAEIAKHNRDNELFLTCLRERNRQRRPVSEAKASRTYAPKEFALMPEAKGLTLHGLEAAMDRLFRVGAIERGFLFREDGKDKSGLREGSADLSDEPADLPADLPRTPDDDVRSVEALTSDDLPARTPIIDRAGRA